MKPKPIWSAFANPAARAGQVGRQSADWEQKLRATQQVKSMTRCRSQEDMIQQVQAAIQAGERNLLVVGGDGTIHTVVNAILSQAEMPSTDITLGVYPFGSGNDWIKSHGVPKKWTAWASMLAEGNTRLQSVGKMNYHTETGPAERYFINVAGMAYDGYVVRETHRHPRRWLPPKVYYLIMILRSLWSYQLQGAEVKWLEGTLKDRFYTINAGIGRYSGGGMRLCPHADPSSDQLALTAAGALSKLGVLFNSWRFYTDRIGEHPKVDCWHAPSLSVRSTTETPILLEADGEFLGHGPVRIEIIPNCLRVLVP